MIQTPHCAATLDASSVACSPTSRCSNLTAASRCVSFFTLGRRLGPSLIPSHPTPLSAGCRERHQRPYPPVLCPLHARCQVCGVVLATVHFFQPRSKLTQTFPPRCVLYTELVQTNKRYMRNCCELAEVRFGTSNIFHLCLQLSSIHLAPSHLCFFLSSQSWLQETAPEYFQ